MARLKGIIKDGTARCPKCNSIQLDYGSYEPVDDNFKQEVTCRKCDFTFNLWADKPKYWEVYY